MLEPVALDVLDIAIQATTAYGRPDLGARLHHRRQQSQSRDVRVLVVGEFKQGKSQLINALVNAPICPVDDDVATSVATVVRYSSSPTAALVWDHAAASSGTSAAPQHIDLNLLSTYVSEAGNPANRQRIAYAEVGIPSALLARGLVLIDTPGVGGLGSAHGAVTMATLPTADAVILVSDAAQEHTTSEMDFFRQAIAVCPTVICVLTKIDLYPHWRDIARANLDHLVAIGIDAPLISVSAALRLHASKSGNDELTTESGFTTLIDYIDRHVLTHADRLTRRAVSQEIVFATEQLASTMQAELAAQRAGERSGPLLAKLERAEQRLEQLRHRSARWQQALSDGITDLMSDIEHDLRERLRQVTKNAEEEIDRVDPAKIADQFDTWLHQRVSAGVSANFVWSVQRSQWLATQVAEYFADEGSCAIPDILAADSAPTANSVDSFSLPKMDRYHFGERLINGLRGGYGGTLMIGMLGTVTGFALLNPVSIAAGMLLGGKTVYDERKKFIQRRQQEAKAAVRRYVDDVTFQVGKESRDTLRTVQRTLRDHFTGYAEELHRSVSESLLATQRAVHTGTAQREQRILDLEAELVRIAELERRAHLLDQIGEVGVRFP